MSDEPNFTRSCYATDADLYQAKANESQEDNPKKLHGDRKVPIQYVPPVAIYYMEKSEKLEAKVEELTKVMEAARDDLLMRGDIDSQGCRVVNMSATTWSKFCDAIDNAALSQDEPIDDLVERIKPR